MIKTIAWLGYNQKYWTLCKGQLIRLPSLSSSGHHAKRSPGRNQEGGPYLDTARGKGTWMKLLLFVGCITSQQHASVTQGGPCSDNCTCCHAEMEVGDQACYLALSQYTNIGPTSPGADLIMPGARHGSHWFTGKIPPGISPMGKAGIEPMSAVHEANALPQGQRVGSHIGLNGLQSQAPVTGVSPTSSTGTAWMV